jgi:hypothetical protein
MDTMLTLTDDQRLRLALLDRCLPVAGVQAVALAEGAYAFLVGLSDAARSGEKIDMPVRPAAPAPQIATEEPGSGVHAGVAETAAKTAMVAQCLADMPSTGTRASINQDARIGEALDAISHLQAAALPVTKASIANATGIPLGSMTEILYQAARQGRLEISGSNRARVYMVRATAPAAPVPPVDLDPPKVALREAAMPVVPSGAASGMQAVIEVLEGEGHEVLPQLEGGFLVDGQATPAVALVGRVNRLRRSRHEPIIEVTPDELRSFAR